MGQGVIGRGQEHERHPAVTLLAGHLPDVDLRIVHFQPAQWREILADSERFHGALRDVDEPRLFVLLADPFTTPMTPVLDGFNASFPGVPLVGGMVSGARRAGSRCLLLRDTALTGAAVAVAFEGAIEADVIVSQGCRPVGRPFKVTRARDNLILSLEGEPPLARIQELISGLSPQDRAILENGLFVGRAISRETETLGRGGFLIRGVTGADQQTGAIAVGDDIRRGEIVQFHLRDAATATEDMEMLLSPQAVFERPRGGLLFSCNGRGRHLYDHPNGDLQTVEKVVGDVRVAGFFCAGEIGPVGGRNFLHGHTASMVFFRQVPERAGSLRETP